LHTQGFLLPNPGKLGAITAIFSAVDYSKSGTCDMVVGRDDGSLEVRCCLLMQPCMQAARLSSTFEQHACLQPGKACTAW
jgi:hypothetical protein